MVESKVRLLTKTGLMKGFQCPKQLYLQLNHPELAQKDNNDKIKKEGTEIGIIAQQLFPSGFLISEKDPIKALSDTEIALKNNKVIFEAAFKYEDLYFRADVFEQTNEGVILTEVKSSTDVKSYQVQDASIQALILTKLGYKIKNVIICHVNREYNLDLKLKNFFILKDVTKEVNSLIKETDERISEIKKQIENNPKIDIGPQCTKPFVCPFKDYCFSKNDVKKDSVIYFPHLSNKWDLFNKGKRTITDLTESDLKTDGQKKLFAKIKSKSKIIIDLKEVRESFNQWKRPLYFLDFETIDTIFPKYPNTKPNTPITYQFSLAKLDSKGTGKLINSYIATDISKDPRKELAENLIRSIGKRGSIVTYNMSFEKARINELIELIPEYKNELSSIKNRIVDLYQVVKDNVYHRDFNLSWSIKSVVPAIFGEEACYSNLAVKNGLESQEIYLSSINEGTIATVKEDLIEYCNKDVMEMVNLYLFLKKRCNIKK